MEIQAQGTRHKAQGTRHKAQGFPPHSSLLAHPWIPALSTSALLQIVLMAGLFLLNFFIATDPDMWWHMATGRYIVETGTIPRVDPFSYTAAGKPWVAHEWLAEVIMYLLYRSGGYLVPVLFFGALTTLTFWTTLRTLRLLGLKAVAASCITFWVALMSLASWDVRPQTFSYLFFSLYLYLLLRSRERPDRWLWVLPATMVLWVNLHAGYVMGLLLLGFVLVGEGINRLREKAQGRRREPSGDGEMGVQGDRETRGRGDAETRGATRASSVAGDAGNPALVTHHSSLITHHSSLKRYFAVAFATLAASAVNPQGLSMLLYPFTYAGTENASMKYITEWQSPDFHYYFFFVFGASMMALMVAPSRRPVDWVLAVPLLALTAMSLQAVRVIPFYAIAAAPFLGMRFAPPGTKHQAQGTGGEADGETHQLLTHRLSLTTGRRRATRWNWLLLMLCLATMASTIWLSDRPQLGPEPRTSGYPAAGAQYLREAGLKGNLINTFHWGGFLIWTFYPERRVFIDGRPDMYGDQFMEDYRKIYDVHPGWKEVLDTHQVEVALVEKEGRVATLLLASGEWREVFQGEIESVLVRSPRRTP